MNDRNMLYGVCGLVLGIVLTWVFASTAVNNQNMGMMRMMGINRNMMNQYSMSGMMNGITNSLNARSGDDFDRVFISEMVVHHEGAISMANAALRNAKHQEIKNMANEIITTQSREINQLNDWYNQWYK